MHAVHGFDAEGTSRQRRLTAGLGEGLLGNALRQPPVNLEAEQAVLGAILANNKALERVDTFLRPEHFAEPAHGAIYARILERVMDGQVADPITLRADFEGTGTLDEVGGAVYLVELLGAMVGVINAGEYGQLIVDAWMKRQIIEMAEGAAQLAYGVEAGLNPAKVLDRIRLQLLEIEAHTPNPGTMKSLRSAVDEAIAAGEAAAARGTGLSGISCGFPSLDAFLLGLEPATNTVIAARPRVGKTALAVQMALRMARLGHRGLYVSLEMEAAKLARRALSLVSRIKLQDIRRGEFARDDGLADDIVRARAVLADLPLLIEDEPRLTHQTIAQRARLAERKLGRLDWIMVDHLHIVGDDDRMARMPDIKAIAEKSAAIRAIGQRMKIPVITLAQLSRAVESREDQRPTLADLRGSGAIEQDADSIGFIYRPEVGMRPPVKKPGESDGDYAAKLHQHNQGLDEVRGKAWVNWEKVREGEPGSAELRFDGARVRFHEIDEK